MRSCTGFSSLLAVLALTAAPLAASTIHLVDGRVLEGVLVAGAPAGSVAVRLVSASYDAVIEVPRESILSIDFAPGPHEQALAAVLQSRRQLEADPHASAAAYLDLATRAKAIGEDTLSRRIAEEVLAQDGGNIEAHRLLDEVQVNGVWMSLPQAMAARGLVFYQDRWMPRAQADELRRAAEQEARQHAQDIDWQHAVQPAAADFGGMDTAFGWDSANDADVSGGDAYGPLWWPGTVWIGAHHHGHGSWSSGGHASAGRGGGGMRR